MTDYVYGAQQEKFSARDGRAPGDPEKTIKGVQMDSEFNRLGVVSTEKLNKDNPAFTGVMTGGTIDGGAY